MLSSLRARLWFSYFLIVGVVVFVSGLALVVYLLRNPAADRREVQRLRLIAGVIEQRRPAFNAFEGLTPGPRLLEAAQRADAAFDIRVALFDPQGGLIVDSRADQAAAFPTWANLRRPLRPNLPSYRDSAGVQWLYVLSSMESGNYLLVAVRRPRLPLAVLWRDEFVNLFLRILGMALALSLLMALWVGRWIERPLQDLSQAAQALPASLTGGQFQPIPLQGPREVRTMAAAFNAMAGQLQASQRAQRDLIANVSHDLKTPLTSIQGFAQAILDGTAGDPASQQQAAQVIYTEAGRMHRMALNLLDLARMDAGTFSFEHAPLDLDTLLRDVAQKFSPQARQGGITLTYTGGPTGLVNGDADRLAQVFSNLVDNALKFTPAGGQVQLSARRDGDWLEARVEDDGPGLAPQELERIFERFYQADKARSGGRRGAGLGLAIARQIVEAHRGQIWAANRSAERAGDPGSVFIVRLPLAG